MEINEMDHQSLMIDGVTQMQEEVEDVTTQIVNGVWVTITLLTLRTWYQVFNVY